MVAASLASSPAACWVYQRLRCALGRCGYAVMLRAISWFATRYIIDVTADSLVVAVCSSTAVAMVFWMSLIWAMIWLISVMPSIAP